MTKSQLLFCVDNERKNRGDCAMPRTFATVLLIAVIIQGGAPREAAADHQQDRGKLDLSRVISGPRPEYPYEARRARIMGSGVIVLELDRSTGKVKTAYMAPSTGSPILDRAALDAFRQWRFKPGTQSPIKTPITFTVGLRGSLVTDYRVKQKPMDEALAHFLGKGTVLKGPIPAYPRFPSWSFKRGKGVYELHIQKDGSVADVKILKGSGDDTFDRVTVKTLREWRFRRGPLVLELPLQFTLTPASYAVEIPKEH